MKKKRFIHIIACMSTLFLFMAVLSRFWASLTAQLIKNLPAVWETLVWFLGQEELWRRDRLPIPVFWGFPCDSARKESTRNVEDLGWEDLVEKGKTTHSSILVFVHKELGTTEQIWLSLYLYSIMWRAILYLYIHKLMGILDVLFVVYYE